jgi:hypothetical protein
MSILTFHLHFYMGIKVTVPCMSDPRRVFGLEIGIIDHLEDVITNCYNTIANSHTLQTPITHAKYCQSAVFLPAVPW